MLRLCAAVFAFVLLGAPTGAHAWTSAQVRDVRVEIAVASQGAAEVTLDIGVEVLGGYLSRFDLEGLDEELALVDGQAAWLTTDQGVLVPAEAVAEGGAITLRFDKRKAARKGLHRIFVRYATALVPHPKAEHPDRVELAWALPGWEQGLSRAEIVVRGPKGLAVVPDAEQAVQVSQRVEQGKSVIELVRVLVPRATPWTITLEAKASTFAAGRSHPRVAPSEPPSFARGVGLSLLVLAAAFLSRRSFRVEAARRDAVASPWMASSVVRRALVAMLLAVAMAAAPYSLPVLCAALLSLVACFVDRVHVWCGPSPLGRFAPLDAKAQRTLRRRLWRERLGMAPWADAATLSGLLGLVAWLAAAFYLAEPQTAFAWLCALPLWAASSRLRLPRSTTEQVALLLSAAERALALSCGMRLVAFVVGEHGRTQPRLRIVPATRFSGLLRIDVAVDTRRTENALVLIAVAQAHSLSDRALGALFGHESRELSPRGHRVAYVQPIEELGHDLERVLSALAAHGQRAVESADTQRAA